MEESKLYEDFIKGKWDSEHVDETVYKLLSSEIYNPFLARIFNFIGLMKNGILNMQNHSRAKKVIDEHYNLPPDFFEKILDSNMQYTCAYFKDENDDLNKAQENKLELICKKLDLQKGESVLDLGGGWGGLAKHMAKNYGVNVDIVTLSKEQANYAKEFCKGFPVKINLCDYREIPNKLKGKKFEKIASIGMMEHIGHKNYRKFMEVAFNSLNSKGLFLLHTIYTLKGEYAKDPWFNKHIFPNGELPSANNIHKARRSLFEEFGDAWYPYFEDLTPSYDKTCMAWAENLEHSFGNESSKLNEQEYRKYKYYFESCAGAFRAKHMRVGQWLFEKHS